MDRETAIIKINEIKHTSLQSIAGTVNVNITGSSGKVNKGWAGTVIEKHLGSMPNSRQEPDFGDWELKAIPLKYLKNGSLSFKETMAVTMIDPEHIVTHDFEDSHLYDKLKSLLIVARTVGRSYKDDSFIYDVKSVDLSSDLFIRVKEDYNKIKSEITTNGFNNLSSSVGTLIQARTKGEKGNVKKRAFYAKKELLKELFDLKQV